MMTKQKDIAIIGMSGRFPGAKNIDEFWQNLQNGIESVRYFSDQELLDSGIDPASLENPNYVKAGAILEDIRLFDADFFSITAREAASLDPQHRLLLECAWETLEHAGYCPSYDGNIGVYAGSRISEYLLYNQPIPDMHGLNAESGSLLSNWKRILDNDKDTLATRIAYTLNLKGAAISIQTACSTSLVALHMACLSLFRGECDIILTGGVCVRVPQKSGYLYNEGMIFSPDAHTRAFDAEGKGTIFSSGVGMVALKCLDKALLDKDCIHAVIKGSAINNDGAAMKAAFTAPAVEGQTEVIVNALNTAQLNADSISYIEAHGTATTHGDLTEISSLSKAFRLTTNNKGFCALGSVKSNIGHPTQAAGIIGLIKTILMLKHKKLVPHLHFKTPNPNIDFANSPFYVNTTLTDWKTDAPRRAGINSFGVGGTNAHVILEEAPVITSHHRTTDRSAHVLCFSAKNNNALQALALRYQHFFTQYPESVIANVCYTANTGRTHFMHRIAIVGDSLSSLEEKLNTMIHSDSDDIMAIPAINSKPKIVFLFSGQGAQYIDMGRQLFDSEPCFRKNMKKCDQLLRPYLPHPLLSVLYPKKTTDTPLLDQTIYTQTALFSLEYALYKLWQSWGIQPDIVMGHSVGEYVAACVAGVFDLKEGLRLMAKRGQLMQGMSDDGAMAAIFANKAMVKQLIQSDDNLSIAAINGPENIVISGDKKALQSVLRQCHKTGIKTQPLKVSHAFHSPHIDPIMDNFTQFAKTITFHPPKIKLLSNVTGQLVTHSEVSSADYWGRHLREPVMFSQSIDTLTKLGYQTFIELGPSSTLLSMAKLCKKADNNKIQWLASLKKGQDWLQILQSLGTLYSQGAEVNWSKFDQHYERQKMVLPTYPFQRQIYWLDKATKASSLATEKYCRHAVHHKAHPLLGHRLSSALSEIQFESSLCIESTPFLKDHRILDRIIFPATAFIEMIMSAATQVLLTEVLVIEDLVIRETLILPQNEKISLQTILTQQENNYTLQIFSLPEKQSNSGWTCHIDAKIGLATAARQNIIFDTISLRCQEVLPVDQFYHNAQQQGVTHGAHFQAVQKLWRNNGEALAQICLPQSLQNDFSGYHCHPVLLDACLHISKASFPDYHQLVKHQTIYLPTIFERIYIYGTFTRSLWSYVQYCANDDAKTTLRTVNFYVFDDNKKMVAEIQGLHLKRATQNSLLRHMSFDDWLYNIQWLEKTLPEKATTPIQQGLWLIFSDNNGVGSQLAEYLREQKDHCLMIYANAQATEIKNDIGHINPLRIADFKQLMSTVLRLQQPLRGILFLWGLSGQFTTKNQQTIDIQNNACASVLYLIQALANPEAPEASSMYIITRGAQPITENDPLALDQSPLWGLGKVAAREHPKLHCTLIDLDPRDPNPPQNEIRLLVNELQSTDNETQIGFRKQQRYVSRLVRSTDPHLKPFKLPTAPYFRLALSTSGILNNMTLQAINRQALAPGDIEIRVHATGLNFRDVLSALGKYPGNPGPPGRECSGTITAIGSSVKSFQKGDKVLAIAAGCFSNVVTTPAQHAVIKPDYLSFEAAATIPITFLTAYHALYSLGQLKAGEKVLIHAAAGGVGLAAIQLVQWAGAKVYATASLGKWDYLKSLGIEFIMNSRNTDFADELMNLTQGQGVDIVLNSLAGDFIEKSFSVLAKKGRFIEIGKSGIWDTKQVAKLRPDITYFPFDLGDIAHQTPVLFQAMFEKIMLGFEDKILSPLPQKRFPIEEAIRAFRYMAQAKHIGKIVIYQCPEQKGKKTPLFRAHSTYLITGGLGALGLKMAHWLTTENAQHIVLLGRSKATEEANQLIEVLKKKGVQINVRQADVANQQQITDVFNDIKENMPPLRGVIHAAGLLDDGVLMQQTWQRFVQVMTPKMMGAWHLHQLTLKDPLDFFVLFSSISSLWGTPGQSNYAAANAFLDALAHFRHAQKLPCISINWGSWADVGMAANLDNTLQQKRKSRGLGVIDVESGLNILAEQMSRQTVQTAVINVDWQGYQQQFSNTLIPPFFSEIMKEKVGVTTNKQQKEKKQPKFLLQITKAPIHQRQSLLTDYVKEQAAKQLGLPSAKSLILDKPLVQLGLDSLAAIELRNAFEFAMGHALPTTLLYDNPTLESIIQYLAEKINEHAPLSESSADNRPPFSPNMIPEIPSIPSMIAIHTEGNKPPFFSVNLAPLSVHLYVGEEQPIYYFNAIWNIEPKLLTEISIKNTATQHIKEMQTIQPKGPYYLGGYSIGGLIAYEIAQQLYQQGEEVALLFLLEPISPVKFSNKEIMKGIRYDEKNDYWLKDSYYQFKVVMSKLALPSFHTLSNRLTSWPPALKTKYIGMLYRLAQNNYFAKSYPGQMIIYKVNKASTVRQMVWKQLAEKEVEIKTIDLHKHLSITNKENDSKWIRCLKEALEKSQG